ncbi:hypothetical protein PRNP1_004766 [Phytophthora ramorum]
MGRHPQQGVAHAHDIQESIDHEAQLCLPTDHTPDAPVWYSDAYDHDGVRCRHYLKNQVSHHQVKNQQGYLESQVNHQEVHQRRLPNPRCRNQKNQR